MQHPRAWRRSDALQLMIAPAREYQARVLESRCSSWPRALAVPGLIAILLGIVTAIAATGRVTVSLVLSQTLTWSFVPALQLLTGTLVILTVRRRRVELARAVELLFAAHGPWSLWLIFFAVGQGLPLDVDLMLASAAVPVAWTAVMVSAFGREVLGLSGRTARLRAFGHQAVSVTLMVLYIELATALSTRIIGALES